MTMNENWMTMNYDNFNIRKSHVEFERQLKEYTSNYLLYLYSKTKN